MQDRLLCKVPSGRAKKGGVEPIDKICLQHERHNHNCPDE